MLVHIDETQYRPRIIHLETNYEYYKLIEVLDEYVHAYEDCPGLKNTRDFAFNLRKQLLET